jgi:hypothetical protein
VCGGDSTAPDCVDGTRWFDQVNTIYSAVSLDDEVIDLSCVLTGKTIRWDDTCEQGERMAIVISGAGGQGPILGKELPNFFRRTGYSEIISNFEDVLTQCYETIVTYATGCPLGGGSYVHCGLDLAGAGSSGKEIRSPYYGEATVVYAGWTDSGYGNMVKLQVVGDGGDSDPEEDEYYMLFGHMSSVSVHSGEVVDHNDLLGYVGTTGNSTGPHVHFEIRSGGASSSYDVNACYVVQFSGQSCAPTSSGGFCSNSSLR